ncbi:MAG: hypothetical protein IJI43_00595 [Bacilli bacterium]|nr:hypothetical protein [Bacilli bacterium]
MQVTDEYIKEVSDNLDISKFHNINGFDLNDYEIEVLNRYDIDYKNCSSLKDVLFLIEEVLNDGTSDMDDLEEVSISIGDRDYYENTEK